MRNDFIDYKKTKHRMEKENFMTFEWTDAVILLIVAWGLALAITLWK